MEVKGRRFLLLYLTDWQIRMVKDFLGIECHRWTIPIGDMPITLYGMIPPHSSITKKMYLTDWQIREIRAETGECCDYIELERKIVPLYGISPEEYIELEKKPFKLKLTEKQKKLLENIIGKDKDYVELPFVGELRMVYAAMKDKSKVEGVILEFSDAQKKEMEKILGRSFDFVKIDKNVRAF